ncbi:MAG: hypothetical protein GY749_03140 [Desulfobacteraceae bacterium]|nr:hypothetical protein [Desulfobacteraceae bacterium]
MLNLNLNIEPRTEERLKKILEYTDDQEIFAQNIIAWQIAELKKSTLNIRIDIKEFEDRYNMKTEDFYHRFEQGAADDTEDFIIWSGLYEMLCENERRLKGLE